MPGMRPAISAAVTLEAVPPVGASVHRADHRISGEQTDQPLDLAPLAKVKVIALCSAAVGARGSFGRGGYAEAGQQVGSRRDLARVGDIGKYGHRTGVLHDPGQNTPPPWIPCPSVVNAARAAVPPVSFRDGWRPIAGRGRRSLLGVKVCNGVLYLPPHSYLVPQVSWFTRGTSR